MNTSYEKLLEEMKTKNIRLSHQRLKIVEYLALNRYHPTAEQIFLALQKEIPTLSRTTVYNTLRMLEEEKLVRTIKVNDKEASYDISLKDHGHFKCEVCGAIYDFDFDADLLASEELDAFKVKEKLVQFKGICPKCL